MGFVVEMSAERRDNGLGLGGVITAHGGEDGTVMGRCGEELEKR
jgi:hypothetical protein